jgi:hypothetical protein
MELKSTPQTNKSMIRKLVYLRDNKDKIDFDKLFQRLTGKLESEKILKDLIESAIKFHAPMIRSQARIPLVDSLSKDVDEAAKYFENTREPWHEQAMFIELDPAAQLGHLVNLGLLQFTPDKTTLIPTDYCVGVLCGKAQQMLESIQKEEVTAKSAILMVGDVPFTIPIGTYPNVLPACIRQESLPVSNFDQLSHFVAPVELEKIKKMGAKFGLLVWSTESTAEAKKSGLILTNSQENIDNLMQQYTNTTQNNRIFDSYGVSTANIEW